MRAVQRTRELARVAGLPRRKWADAHAEEMARRLTEELRAPGGTMTLRPVQAMALAEIKALGGILAPIRVGAGKTLISLLAGSVVGAKRPVLLVPAKLRDKTQRDLGALRRQWRIPTNLRVISYEMLGRADHAELLEEIAPDLIVADEVHRIKNPRAAVTRRVIRYLAKGACGLVAMSGTITRRSLRDYAHLLQRALGVEQAPVPRGWSELEEWSDALDETKGDRNVEVGALELLTGDAEAGVVDPLARCRMAFRRRLVETPGVVATEEHALGTALSISFVRPPVPRAITAALEKLRADWELPDGTPLADALAIWRHAREISLGFWYRWAPAAPLPWLQTRRDWCSACREVLSNNRRNLDSELQVVRAVDAGLYPKLVGHLERWREVKDSFVPNPVAEWLSNVVVAEAAKRAEKEPAIVWYEHRAVADELEEWGLDIYGARGLNARGRMIEDADPMRSVAASIASNSEGRNLQAWSRNLILSPPASGASFEQLLGRTHRDGQQADEVSCLVVVTCEEHEASFRQALADARYVQDCTGVPQKLLYADRSTD